MDFNIDYYFIIILSRLFIWVIFLLIFDYKIYKMELIYNIGNMLKTKLMSIIFSR